MKCTYIKGALQSLLSDKISCYELPLTNNIFTLNKYGISKYVSVSGIIHKLFWNVMYQKRRINIGNILIHSIYVWFDVDVPIILNLSIINKCVLLIDLCMALLLWMSCLKAHNNVFSGSLRAICLSIIQDYSLPYIKN